MKTVEQAKQILFETISLNQTKEIEITDALNYVLAEDVYSPIDLPSFNQSAMDGYAVCSGGNLNRKEFDIVGEIKAGDTSTIQLNPSEGVRIFTGAEVPKTADVIIVQEKVSVVANKIKLTDSYKINDHIRFKGAQIKTGDLAIKKFTVLTPGAIGFVAMLGLNKVKVYSHPNVSIIVTGNEIVTPGEALVGAKVYESNSYAISSALKQMGIENIHCSRAIDEESILEKKVEEAISISDVIILTGGISVGKYDLVYDTLQKFGTEVLFYKVLQKPGKPILAGKINNKLVFALPGNPASALVCFYEYVYPSILKMIGMEKFELRKMAIKSTNEIIKKEGRALFIRSKITDDGVIELKGQGSDMLKAFAESDSFIYLAHDKNKVDENEVVEVHLLPGY
ncbi:MAG: molybdopterin molybdotransferase MoeA [Bacteroidetes bacterium]|nr:molybdopterin molybdotransferase MoeA [Bacteroidota bacterium]